jgi:hypothetical protein
MWMGRNAERRRDQVGSVLKRRPRPDQRHQAPVIRDGAVTTLHERSARQATGKEIRAVEKPRRVTPSGRLRGPHRDQESESGSDHQTGRPDDTSHPCSTAEAQPSGAPLVRHRHEKEPYGSARSKSQILRAWAAAEMRGPSAVNPRTVVPGRSNRRDSGPERTDAQPLGSLRFTSRLLETESPAGAGLREAAGQGLEPRLPDPESGVLPLDDPAGRPAL